MKPSYFYQILKIFLLKLLVVFSIPLTFSENNIVLGEENVAWSTILTGAVLGKMQEVEDGVAVLSEGGNVYLFNKSGKKVATCRLSPKTYQYITALSTGFLVLTGDKRRVALLNPSCTLLWEKEVSFDIVGEAVESIDKNLYIKGREHIASYTITGRKRYIIKLEEQDNMPLLQLNDGSILSILKNSSSGSRVARLSPFGKLLEIIEYEATIYSARQTKEGTLLSFTTGEFGLSYQEPDRKLGGYSKDYPYGRASIKWALTSKEASNEAKTLFILLQGTRAALITNAKSGVKVLIIDYKEGSLIDNFLIPSIQFSDIKEASSCYGAQKLFILTSDTCYIYELNGALTLKRAIEKKKKDKNVEVGDWEAARHLDAGLLLLSYPDWQLDAYKTLEYKKVQSALKKKEEKKSLLTLYNSFIPLLDYSYIDKSVIRKEDTAILKAGSYGTAEAAISARVYSVFNLYRSAINSSYSFNNKDKSLSSLYQIAEHFDTFITNLALLSNVRAASYLEYLLLNEKNFTNLLLLFQVLPLYPYDPYAQIIQALNTRRYSISLKDTRGLNALLEAVKALSNFMGDKYLNKYCLNLLTSLTQSQYPEVIRKKARSIITVKSNKE